MTESSTSSKLLTRWLPGSVLVLLTAAVAGGVISQADKANMPDRSKPAASSTTKTTDTKATDPAPTTPASAEPTAAAPTTPTTPPASVDSGL